MRKDITLEELKNEKEAMEYSIKNLIKKFIYDTDTVPRDIYIEVNTVKSFTGATVLVDDIKVSLLLEI